MLSPSPLRNSVRVDEDTATCTSTASRCPLNRLSNIRTTLPTELLRIIVEAKMNRETRGRVPNLRRMLAHVTVLEHLEKEIFSTKPVVLKNRPPTHDQPAHVPAKVHYASSETLHEQIPELHSDDDESTGSDSEDEWSSEDDDDEGTTLDGSCGGGHGEVRSLDQGVVRPDEWARLLASYAASKNEGLEVEVRECEEDDV